MILKSLSKKNIGILTLLVVLLITILLVGLYFSGIFNGNTLQEEPLQNDIKVSYNYASSGLILDLFIINKDKNLYAMGFSNFGRVSSEVSEKPYLILDNVISVSNYWALKEDGTLWNISPQHIPYKIADNVKYFESAFLFSVVYLKNDHTFWKSGWVKGLSDRPEKLLTNVKSFHTDLVIKTDNSLWKVDSFSSKAVKITDNVSDIKHIKVEEDFTSKMFIIKDDNSLWELDYSSFEQLSNKRVDSYLKMLLSDVVELYFRNSSYYALKLDHGLWAWGNNDNGQIGNGTQNKVEVPIKVLDGVKTVKTTGEAVYVHKDDNSVWTWGKDLEGNIKPSPNFLIGDVKERFSVGYPKEENDAYTPENMVFLKNNNQLFCINNYSANKQPTLMLENVKSCKYTERSINAITQDGNLWSWGDEFNPYGWLTNEPMKVADGATAIVDCQYITFFTKSDGSLWAVGHLYKWINGKIQVEKADPTPWKVFP